MSREKSTRRAPFIVAIVLLSGLVDFEAVRAAPPAAVSARVSASSVQVAEPFTLEVEVIAPAGSKVVFPNAGTQLGDFDITDQQDLWDVPAEGTSDARIWKRRLTLESIVTGDLHIPSMEIQVTGDAAPEVLRSQEIPVQVISVLEDRSDPTQFRDIQSVVNVASPPEPSRNWTWWAMGGCAAIAIAAVVFFTRRGRWLTPDEWLSLKLSQLENSLESSSFHSREAALQLTTIIRDYFQLRFAIRESGRTAQELLAVIEESGHIDAEASNRLGKLLAMSDEVKFAGLKLTRAEFSDAIAEARLLAERIGDGTTLSPNVAEGS